MTCPCDQRAWPPTLAIPAGLHDLPRQLVTFDDLRAEMLARARTQPALAAWRARAIDDYGLMLLELWAYVGELLSIYDKAIADESYVRTAKLRPSLRRLVAGLGYVPRPAVAATVQVALIAEGKQPVKLPDGTAFRSGAFGAEPPQVFELTQPATIHPALNRWDLMTPPVPYLLGEVSTILLDPHSARVAAGDVILIELEPYSEQGGQARKATAVDRIVDGDGRRLVKVTLDRPLEIQTAAYVSKIRIRKATRQCDLKKLGPDPGENPGFHRFTSNGQTWWCFHTDGLHPHLRAGERVLMEHKGLFRAARLHERFDSDFMIVAAPWIDAVTINLPDDKTVTVPGHYGRQVDASFTVVRTTENLDAWYRQAGHPFSYWHTETDPTQFVIHFDLIECGTIVAPLGKTLAANQLLRAVGTHAPLGSSPSTEHLILRDAEDRGVAIGGSIALATGKITRDPHTGWSPPLAAQVEGFGNVVTLTRGETVPREVLGSGDPSAKHQAFKLAKKPLTYVNAPNTARGVASTLTVWVDGLEWDEVPTLFGHGGHERVYVVRQDDAGASTVTFGDGIRGSRLPSGVGNVIASYRYGAGAAAPPAGSIAQLAKPVKGLKQVVGPLPAGGGGDAEPASHLRTLAPRTAVLLGRAISLDDMDVAAREVPGVVTSRVDWTWDKHRQGPLIKVWVLGGAGVVDNVAARLRALAEPGTPIDVEPAKPVSEHLAIDLEIDPRQVVADVIARAHTVLLAPGTGWLTPAQLGIDTTLFRSQLVAALLTIRGVVGLRGLTFFGAPWLATGISPGVGRYFDLSHTYVTGGWPKP